MLYYVGYAGVYVYDKNPVRRILALSEGFQVPERNKALSHLRVNQECMRSV